MCGGGVVGDILHPLVDVAAAYFGGPIGEAALQTGEGLAGGDSIGKALGQGAIGGAETFAGQEIGGALSNAFPETATSLGVTPSNGNSLTDLLGATSGQGALTGPGTALDQFENAGSNITNLFSGSTSQPVSTTGSSTSSNLNPSATTAPGATNSSVTGSGPAAASAPSPSGAPSSNPLDNFLTQNQNLGISTGTGQLDLSGNGQGALSFPSTSAPSSLPSLAGQSFSANLPDLSGGSSGQSINQGILPSLDSTGVSTPGAPINFNGESSGISSNSNPLQSNISQNYSSEFNSGSPVVPSTGVASDFSTGLGGAPSLNSDGLNSFLSSNVGSPNPTSAPTSGSAFLSNPSLGTFTNMLEANPAAVISAGGIGLDALEQGKLAKGQRQLQQIAGQQNAQGQQLQTYLETGTLPPGIGAALNQAAEAQKASIKSRYASAGSSGSSAEQQDLAAVDAYTQGQGAQIAMQLLTTGINESGLSSQLYENIANQALEQDNALGSAIGNFASSVAGGNSAGSEISQLSQLLSQKKTG